MKIAIAIAFGLLPRTAIADGAPSPQPPSIRISVETDPLDFLAFDGWGAFVVARPAAFGRWAVRLGGGVAYPPKWIAETNGNEGWTFGYDPVGTVALQRFFSTSRGGLFATLVLGAANIDYTGPSGNTTSLFQLQLQAGAGYRWFPLANRGFVITPYLTVVAPIYRSKEPTIDGKTYKTIPVAPVPEILIGWEFTL